MKGSGLALLLGSKKEMDDEESSEVGQADAFDDAARACFNAAKDNDKSKFIDSLKDAIKICVQDYDSGPEDDEDEY